MSLVAVYLASPSATTANVQGRTWSRLDCLCASVSLLKKFAPPLPVIVFHEDYTDNDKDRLRAILSDIRFEQIDFSTHKQHFVSQRPKERVGTYGYYMMCRFFSGVVQSHPALAEFTHYMRLDDDSYIIDTVPLSTLNRMQRHDYSYNSTFYDPHLPLWTYACEFMAINKISPAIGYSDQVPYNNYHAASLALWNHPIARKFIDGIEHRHGCISNGWTDSSIQSVLALAIGPSIGMSVNFEPEFPYRHNQQCIHHGPHTCYCVDGTTLSPYHWGPPVI
jgi:hypothetical protein